ncbi:hypothetical protein [Leptospira johnsonii]|uniref:hypothetical protein n=1 Tax=Leptospira johnsonii TaxID=1917820 RepID=UPI000D59AE4C|nr:hypothetical protein [Leptospira johnsonii]
MNELSAYFLFYTTLHFFVISKLQIRIQNEQIKLIFWLVVFPTLFILFAVAWSVKAFEIRLESEEAFFYTANLIGIIIVSVLAFITGRLIPKSENKLHFNIYRFLVSIHNISFIFFTSFYLYPNAELGSIDIRIILLITSILLIFFSFRMSEQKLRSRMFPFVNLIGITIAAFLAGHLILIEIIFCAILFGGRL